jgi:predicted lipoprotein with Yx(FWY)xxD motif
MNVISTRVLVIVLAAVAVVALAACGGSSDSSTGASAPANSDGTLTVSTTSVDGVGEVLIDAEGAALYSPDQEAGGKVLCTGSCESIWIPLTLPAGDQSPTADSDLSAALGIIQRPDGTEQVTFDGKPLYRFAEDPAPGTVTGDGFVDSFDGKSFTWHVASPGGTATGSSSTSSGGYGS